MINKGVLKLQEKKEVMVVDKNSFPPVTIVNTSAVTHLKEALAIEEVKAHTHILKIK